MGGYVYEEFIPELRWPFAGKVYQEMADNDPVVGSIFYMAEMLIRNVDWSTEPDSDKPEDREAADFIYECMNDMDNSWDETITEILSMLTYGYSFHEIVYKIRRGPDETDGKYRSEYTDGKIAWRRIPIRAQRSWYQWEFDDDGDIKAFVQLAYPDFKKTIIPLSKGLLFRTRMSRDNPEGRSMLRNAYRPWYFKKRIEEIEGIGIERDLAGLPVLTAPEGLDLWNEDDQRMTALKANAEQLVQSIRRDSEEGILLPNGWDLKLLATGSARQFDTNQIIDRYDHRIAIVTLADIVLMGQSKGSGSFAMSETKEQLFAGALEAMLDNIAGIFNKYAVNKLLKLNNMPGKCRIVAGEVVAPKVNELALLLRAMGVNIAGDMDLMNYLRKVSSIPQMSEDTFKEVYEPQAHQEPVGPFGKPVGGNDQTYKDPKDPGQKAMEQNGDSYTGQDI